MCPLVTRHDRAEPVVVHFDCDQFPAGRAVMGSRQNTDHRPCRAGPGQQRVLPQGGGALARGLFLLRCLCREGTARSQQAGWCRLPGECSPSSSACSGKPRRCGITTASMCQRCRHTGPANRKSVDTGSGRNASLRHARGKSRCWHRSRQWSAALRTRHDYPVTSGRAYDSRMGRCGALRPESRPGRAWHRQ
jgi:hypothetical protein